MTFVDRFRLAGRSSEERRLRELLRPGPALRLLDVGGGTGAFSERYSRGFGAVTVLEPNAESVRAGAVARRGLRFVRGSAERMPFGDSAFDRVVALRSVHHMDDGPAFLGEARRVLAPDGLLVIEEVRPRTLLAQLMRLTFGDSHRHSPGFLEETEARRQIESAGFGPVGSSTGRRWYFAWGAR